MYLSDLQILEQLGVQLPEHEAENWRRVPVSDRVLCRLRGQDFQGEIVPEITDGVRTYARRPSDGKVLLVMAANVERINWNGIRPRNSTGEPKQVKPKTSRTSSRQARLLQGVMDFLGDLDP